MTVNKKLLEAIRSRQRKQTSFGMGISTADQYVKTLEQCVGHEICNRYACAKTANWQDILTKASESLVYSNEDMVSEKKLITSLTGWKESLGIDDSDLELPKNTLMVFSHVLTSPRKDRDGDRLRSEGAMLDLKMLLLWQHIPTLPIGKLLTILEQNSKRVRNASCIVDMNELCHDAAVMIDNDMGRFSHGFRALAFDALKEEYDPETGPNGYDITSFEIMEESLVSVPSNTDAEVEEVILSLVEGGKLTSDLMKHRGKTIREKRPTFVNVTKDIEENSDEDKSRSGSLTEQGEREGKQGCTCASEETNEDSTKETKTASDAQVKRHGPIEGSWEWIENALRQQAKPFMELSRLVNLRDRYTWVVGTFSDHAIICCEDYCGGAADEYLYFRASWSLEDGKPSFTGSPVAVEIVTTVEIMERSPIFDEKNTSSEDKTSSEDARKMSVDQAIGEIISNADKDERAKLKAYLVALEQTDASQEIGRQFRNLIAG